MTLRQITRRICTQNAAKLATGLLAVLVAGIAPGCRFEIPNPNEDHTACPADSSDEISGEDRLAALATFWKEADYNFAYFDRVPDVHWTTSFVDFATGAMSACTDLEFVRSFQKVAAQLKEGHTYVRMPKQLADRFAAVPGIQLASFNKKAIVINVSVNLAEQIPVGSEIVSVDGKAVPAVLEETVFPYLSASTEQGRWERGVAGDVPQGVGLLAGPIDIPLTLGVRRPNGDLAELKVKRALPGAAVNWVQESAGAQVFEMVKMDDEIMLLRLNSFLSEDVVDQFLSAWGQIKHAKGIILDIRDNRGGNSDYGATIANHFSDNPVVGSPWETRENIATYRAWGKFADQYPPFKRYKPYWEDDAWLVGEPETFEPAEDAISVPIAVLISAKTYSAGEDFAVMMKSVPNTVFFGTATAGSTGQPLFLDLAGGIRAQVTTRRATLQDGTEFVGVGIQPDVEIVQSPIEKNTASDAVVAAAYDYLQSH